ncbi:hypothetical protein N878_26555 [Pseudomonas sp. EGD-AK9]|nr:hypothetical protein N878_26555 [Pseudomonas sp. EGD-AK9]
MVFLPADFLKAVFKKVTHFYHLNFFLNVGSQLLQRLLFIFSLGNQGNLSACAYRKAHQPHDAFGVYFFPILLKKHI